MTRAMASKSHSYTPDYAVSPGAVLAEILDAREMSHAAFASRCGRSAKLISEIIAGKAPLEPETALQFERVLGISASIWLNLEANFQLFAARKQQQDSFRQDIDWVKKFPTKELIKLGLIDLAVDQADLTHRLLQFFGVGSIKAWETRFSDVTVNFRHARTFKSSREALIAWLRVGELWAEKQVCSEFNKVRFAHVLEEIKGFTRTNPDEFTARIGELCNSAGVAFVLVPAIGKIAVSGAARWLTPRKALIQQSDRYKTNDHFWFTFFHEAAHVLLHSKRGLYVDENGQSQPDGEEEVEQEANRWAGDHLVPRAVVEQFRGHQKIPQTWINECAMAHKIDRGILVGRLQHEKIIPFKNFVHLKKKIEIRRMEDGVYTLASRKE